MLIKKTRVVELISARDLNIVFVHNFVKPPPYLLLSLKFSRYYAPSSSIYLLSNYRLRKSFSKKYLIRSIVNDNSKYLDLMKSLEKMYPDQTFVRHNFWTSSILRLLSLLDYSIENELFPLLHLESDCLITAGENLLIDLLNCNKPISVTADNGYAVPAMLYIEKKKSALDLRDFFIEIIADKTKWPSFFLTDQSLLTSALENRLILSMNPKMASEQNVNLMPDSAYIGEYLFGNDPRNQRFVRKTGYVNEKRNENMAKELIFSLVSCPRENYNMIKMSGIRKDSILVNIHNYSKLRRISFIADNKLWRKILDEANEVKTRSFSIDIYMFIKSISDYFYKISKKRFSRLFHASKNIDGI